MLKKSLPFLLLLALVLNCSKNSTEPHTKDPGERPEMAIKEIAVPANMSQSSDPNAQMANAYVTMANSFRGWSYAFAPPVGLNKAMLSAERLGDDPKWSDTWTDNGLTLTMLVFETDDKYMWEVRLTGVDGDQVFDDFLFIRSEQKKDETAGMLIIYDPELPDGVVKWLWDINAAGVYTMSLIFDENTPEAEKLVVASYPDNSGWLEYSEWINNQYVLDFRCEWDAAGAGAWWAYVDGVEDDSGAW